MDDSSSVMSEDDQGIEKTKRRGCNNEHVDRRNVGQVVVQKAMPGGGGDFGPPRQTSPDGGLADLDAELEQLAVDAGAPQSGLARLISWVLHAEGKYDDALKLLSAAADAEYRSPEC